MRNQKRILKFKTRETNWMKSSLVFLFLSLFLVFVNCGGSLDEAATQKVESNSTASSFQKANDTEVNSEEFKNSPQNQNFVDLGLNTLDSAVSSVTWCGDENGGLSNVLVQTVKGTLYRSTDYGKNGRKMSSLLIDTASNIQSEKKVDGTIHNILKSEADSNLIILLGNQGVNWISQDCGETVTPLHTGRIINGFKFHPKERSWVLASAWTDCNDANSQCVKKKELFYSNDLGTSWVKLLDYVYDFDWGHSKSAFGSRVPHKRIIVTRHMKSTRHQPMSGWSLDVDTIVSDDLFSSFKTLVKSGNRFLISSRFLFVARALEESSQQVELLVSASQREEYNFKATQLPFESLEEYSYTILDAEEYQVFLNINHFNSNKELAGNLYISDSHGVRYALSLRNCVRNNEGYVDFERVKGMEGSYLANIYDKDYMDQMQREQEAQETQTESLTKKKKQGTNIYNFKRTVITFDQGSKWQYLRAPELDSLGKPYECGENCYLNLHSLSSSQFGPIYTTKNSLGVIMATGSVGTHLSYKEDEVNTYMSRDGGLTWFEIARGSHIYEISDHGALILLASNTKATTSIYFTWNEGKSWEKLEIGKEPIEIENIVVEPNNIGEKFIIYGEYADTNKKGVMISLNFEDLHERSCSGHEDPGTDKSDYEIWVPHTYNNDKCLMGRKVEYIRRKRDAECFNGYSFDEKSREEHCQCTDDDWECELGYGRADLNAPCTLIEPMYAVNNTPPEDCQNTYTYGAGYRKIGGNSCRGGVNYEQVLDCPSNGSIWGYLFWVLLIGSLGFLVFSKRGSEILQGILAFMSTVSNSISQSSSFSGSDATRSVVNQGNAVLSSVALRREEPLPGSVPKNSKDTYKKVNDDTGENFDQLFDDEEDSAV